MAFESSRLVFLLFVFLACFCWRSDASLEEGEVLFTIKSQWNMSLLTTWVRGEDPCVTRWENVTCRLGNVVGLNVSNIGIVGKLPAEIGSLPFLETLDISNAAEDQYENLTQNAFSGPLPDSLGQLTNLKILNMSMMTWNIPFPAPVGKLTNLVEFRMAEANMTGGLPPEMFEFKNLRVLHLGGNNLINTLSSFTRLTLLRELSLYDIKFKSAVPDSLGNLTELINLSLHDCDLWGPLPEYISKFKDLGRLQLYGNLFTGHIPDSWASLTNLNNFRADGNFLYGPFPRWLLSLPYLSILRLDQNFFYGEIPTKSELNKFKTLRVECNLMNGIDPFPFQPVGKPIQTGENCFTGAAQDTLNDAIRNCNKGKEGFDISCSDVYASYIPQGLCLPCPRNQFRLRVVDKSNPCVCEVRAGPKAETGGGKNVPIGAVVGGVLALFIAFGVVLGFVIWKRREQFAFLDIFKVAKQQDLGDWEIPSGVELFTLQELASVTDNFSDQHIIGAGGFGKVFLGTLADGRRVAIKRAGANSMQGTTEFRNEVTLLSRLHHRHLVRLEGFCEEEGLQILVYEFMPNGNLHSHLLGKITSTPLSWYKRLEIAVGVAQGLEYLHSFADPPVIHRDVKPSNVLLDDKMVAKLADFGISKATAEFDTHVSTRPAGTAGYLDPEYFLRRQLTTASDVYAFGVVLLELITGQEAIDHKRHEEYNLVEWTRKRYKTSGIGSIIDPLIEYEYSREAYSSMTELALLCTAFNKEERPTMRAVLSSLEPHLVIESLYGPKSVIQSATAGLGPRPPESSQRSARGVHITWDSEHTDSSIPTDTMNSEAGLLRPR